MHFTPRYNRGIVLLVAGCLCVTNVSAHAINYALENVPAAEVIWFYLKLGARHIIPEGADHILFIVALCLINSKWKTILWQATAFTVAHSITLALSMKNIITAPGAIVEPVIALSIAFVSMENILLTTVRPWRILVIFIFGLLHGLGFASALNETGLPRNQFYTSIFAFNAGVELGQIAIIAAVFFFIILPFGQKAWYRKFIVYPLSALIAGIAIYWTMQRVM